MTLQDQFESLKQYGYVCDNKADAQGNEHSSANGQFVPKGGSGASSKPRQQKKVKVKENYEYANKVPYQKRTELRNSLAQKLSADVARGTIENDTIGQTKISKHSVGKLGSDKALNKSMANGFTPEEHFDAAERVVGLYKDADLKSTDPDKDGDPNIASIKRFEKKFTTCKGQNARAWITVKESKQHGHRLYTIEVMEIEKAGINPASKSVADKSQTIALNNIPHDTAEVKLLSDMFERIKGGRL